MKYYRIKACLLASGAALCVAAPASAQDTGAASSRDEQASNSIIVTAQRREQDVMDVPVSVTVLSEETLTNRGINDLRGVTKLAPSLQAGQDNQFSIRGIGTATYADTVEPSVTQVIDDVVLGARYFASVGFYDIERVEVLNGPQGLLFGKNASAGVVNITTTPPRLGTFEASSETELVSRYRDGDDGFGFRTQGTVNLPIGKTSALRVNAIYGDQDSIVNISNVNAVRSEADVEEYAFRAKFLTEPTDALSLYVIGDYGKVSGISGTFDYTFRSLGEGSQYPQLLEDAGVTPGPRNLTSVVNGPYFRDLETVGLQAKLAYLFDSGLEISNITAWKSYSLDQTFDSDFTTGDYLNRNAATSDYDQFSNELRVTLPDSNRLSGQAGLYYFYSKNNFAGDRRGANGLPPFVTGGFPFCVGADVSAGPPPACNVSNVAFIGQDYVGTNKNESMAVFGQLSYELLDTLTVTAGGRVTNDQVSLDLLENTDSYFVTLGIPNNRSIGEVENTNFSWRIGVDWEPVPETLVYGFVGQGYKGPGFSNAAPAVNSDLSVEPEISTSGEIGIKQALFDRMMNVSVSAFYTKFDNLQVQAFDAALQTIILQNAAEATTKGVDVNIQAQPARGLTLLASASYVDATYDTYPGRQCYPGQVSASCDATGTYDVSGRQVPLSAKFTSVVSADYEFPLSGSLYGNVGGSYYHRSSLLSEYAPGAVIPSWDTFDANLGIQGDNWRASLFCKNCFNEIRPVSIEVEAGDGINAGALTLLQRWSYDSVRTVGLRVGFDF
ncbi:TonB-dependent receptor [uncultured Croceicoccus sp.]|uniref:TonB-dependent receptor n=1 Tax=uncultured Croceicoccus sp. TaxID=1295329 RepID=UPI002613162F|nr:TonB-dependent receptor [uncultured Croceicoccus sp.]